MASFASVSFDVDTDSYNEKRAGRVAVQEIPGGDAFYVDLAGRSPLNITCKVIVANATAWGTLNATIGTEGVLAIDTLDTHDAVLLSLGRPAPELDGRITGNAEFLVVNA